MLLAASTAGLAGAASSAAGTAAALFIARSAAMGSYTALYIYTPEAYPTRVRSIALGLNSSLARIGGFVFLFELFLFFFGREKLKKRKAHSFFLSSLSPPLSPSRSTVRSHHLPEPRRDGGARGTRLDRGRRARRRRGLCRRRRLLPEGRDRREAADGGRGRVSSDDDGSDGDSGHSRSICGRFRHGPQAEDRVCAVRLVEGAAGLGGGGRGRGRRRDGGPADARRREPPRAVLYLLFPGESGGLRCCCCAASADEIELAGGSEREREREREREQEKINYYYCYLELLLALFFFCG